MIRTAICLALAFILLIPAVPWTAGDAGDTTPAVPVIEELPWKAVEIYDDLPHGLEVQIIDDRGEAIRRYDRLVITLVLEHPAPQELTVISRLSPLEDGRAMGIRQVHILKDGQDRMKIVFEAGDLYLGAFQFPYLFELAFTDGKGGGGRAAYHIQGDFPCQRYRSPHIAGFDEKISYKGSGMGNGQGYTGLDVILTLFTRAPGRYTIIVDLQAGNKVTPEIGIPRMVKDGERDGEYAAGAMGLSDGTLGSMEGVRGGTEGTLGSIGGTMESTVVPGKAHYGSVIESLVLHIDVGETGETRREITLTFSGPRIHATLWSGPFVLSASVYADSRHVDSSEWLLQHLPYSDFVKGKILAWFTGAYGVKGTLNGMDLHIGVRVTEAGLFHIEGEVHAVAAQPGRTVAGLEGTDHLTWNPLDPSPLLSLNPDHDLTELRIDERIPRAAVSLRLDPGEHTIILSFPGASVREGSYVFLTVTSASTGGKDYLDIHLRPTEAPVGVIVLDPLDVRVAVEGPDGDGLFDSLVMDARLRIPSGTYHMEATLRSEPPLT